MLDKKNMYKQLSLDMRCSIEELKSTQNIYVYADVKKEPKTRLWNDSTVCIICLNNKIVARADNKEVLQEIKDAFDDDDGEWFSEIESILKLENILSMYNLTLTHVGPYLIPKTIQQEEIEMPEIETIVYQENELLQFKGDKRFTEALGSNVQHVDKLAVAAKVGNEIIGMAGVSEDSKFLWQLGIDITPKYRGRGIASYLVQQLSIELQKYTDVLPYYGTAHSHITSLNTAIGAGFQFGWLEINAEFKK